MPSSSKVAIGKELRSWDEFIAAMEPFMRQFDHVLREHVLLALYGRADFRLWLEDLRSLEAKRVRRLRQERTRGEEMRQKLEKAIRSVSEAGMRGSVSAGKMDPIRKAGRSLKRAIDDLLFLEELRIALVHPGRRNRTEKKRKVMSVPLEQWKLFPGFGTAQVDHMFIGWMENYLSGLLTEQGHRLSSAEINRIISQTFKAAFREGYEVERVAAVRRQLAIKRSLSGKR